MDEKDIISIITTKDGSNSLYHSGLDETYHSTHGALTESEHVFIKSGLDFLNKSGTINPINVFEVGFGTGLNAWLACIWANEHKKPLNYVSIEPYPVPLEIVEKLNYIQLKEENKSDLFYRLHQCDWGKVNPISEFFAIQKVEKTIQEFSNNGLEPFDIIFFDAFAPRKQEEMWQEEVFKKCFDLLTEEGVIVSYCSSGSFKRGLKKVGFTIESLPGPPGKREMTRGVK